MRLLVIEDDPDLNRQLATALTDAGYVVDRAFDGEEGHYLGETEPYDAVILDIGLPKMDGISVLEAWRRAGRAMPVLMLTARDRWSDKVQGFDAGADDYVAKPFHLEEVLARIRALLRRSAGHAKSEFNCGPVRLDTRTGRVTVDGNPVKLTSHEYRLLSYLMHHTGRVVSRTELVEHLYDQDFDRDSNTIEVFVGRIRKKLGVDVIQTVRGLGYLLTPPRQCALTRSRCGCSCRRPTWTVRDPGRHRHRAVGALPRGGRARLRPPARRLSAHAGRRRRGARRMPSEKFPQSLGEPLFELPLSGWYWQVTRLDTAQAGGALLALAVGRRACRISTIAASPPPPDGTRQGYVDGPRTSGCAWSSAPIDLGDEGRYPGRGRRRRRRDRRGDAQLRPRAGRHLRHAGGRAAADHHVPGALRPGAAQAHLRGPGGDPLRRGGAARRRASRSRSRRSRARPMR